VARIEDQRQTARARAGRAVEAHLGSGAVAKVLYGSIIGLALVVALSAHPPGAGSTIAAIVGTAIAVGLAEVYSEVIGVEARTRRAPRREDLGEAAQDAGAVVVGAAFPAVFFVLAGVGAIELHTAFALAKWTGVGLIAAYGFAAARLRGAPLGSSVMHGLAVAAIGAALIAAKAVLH
jgi:hypothetical protein